MPLGTTPAGAKVYGWWAGGAQSLDWWLRVADVTVEKLDELSTSKDKAPGGTFLFTHQRDYGFVQYWQPGEASCRLSIARLSGKAWPPGGTDVYTFSC